MQKVVFLDRDGVINKDTGYLHSINDFEFIEGISVALRHFLSLGYKLIIITNQSGIGRGYYSVNDFKTLTKWMIEQLSSNGIEILDVLYCPHSPDDNCSCRKPNPGLLLEAKKRHNIEMKCSWIIGDKEDDNAAEVAAFESNLSLEETFEQSIEMVNKALSKLENNTYGLCEKCDNPIAKERLEIMPTATKCAPGHGCQIKK